MGGLSYFLHLFLCYTLPQITLTKLLLLYLVQKGLGTKMDNLQAGLGTKIDNIQAGLGTKVDNIQVGLDSIQATQQSVKKMLSGLESESCGKCKHKKLLKQKPHVKQVPTEIKRKVNQRSSVKFLQRSETLLCKRSEKILQSTTISYIVHS